MKKIIIVLLGILMCYITLLSGSVLAYAATEPWSWPVPASTQANTYEGHLARDIPAGGDNVEILATRSGIVVDSQPTLCPHWSSGVGHNCLDNNPTGFGTYGNYIILKHEDDDGTVWYSRYGHLAYDTIRFSVGDYVKQGELLGYMGSSGASTGQHLHFEIRNSENKRVEPLNYVTPGVIYRHDDYKPSEPTLDVSASDSSSAISFSWNSCENTDWYDVRVYTEDGTKIIETMGIYDLSYSVNLPEGDYYATVHSVNGTHETWTQSNEAHFSVSIGYPEPAAVTTFDGHVYAMYESKTYYEKAQELCHNMGGHLVTITSEKENKAVSFLLDNASDYAYWMGATDVQHEGTWKWETGESFDYENWERNEPNNDSEVEHYLQMYPSGYWNDGRSMTSYYHGFILEIEPQEAVKVEDYRGHLYYRFDSQMNWIEAEEYCKMLGGHLVAINDAEENQFVHSLISDGTKGNYWIGAFDANKNAENHNYCWSTGEEFSYSSWNHENGENQPDCWAGVEFYGEMYRSNGNWNDISSWANSDFGFVCEVAKNIKKLEIAQYPYKLVYDIGEQLDLNGLSLRATYDKGNPEIITDGYDVKADLSKAGKQTVTITYGGMTLSFNVDVVYPKLNAKVDSKSEDAISVSWTEEAAATKYTIIYNGKKIENLTRNNCILTQLTPNTAYEIQILAFNQTEQITDSNILYVATSTALMGDIDGDGTLASNDVRQAQSSIVDPRNAALSNLVADLNYDGVIDVFDLALLKRAAQEQMYAGWTEWSLDAPPENAENVETMTEYRYAEKTYQESSEQLGEPWILSDTKNTMSDFGAWSDWQEGEVKASDNREVENMTDSRSEITGYHMHYFCTRKDSTEFIRWYREYSINGDYEGFGAKRAYGEYDSTKEIGDVVRSVSDLDNAQVVAPNGQFSSSQGGYNMGGTDGYVFADSPYLWFKGEAVTSSYDVTLYRYRDRTEAISYVYYSVGEFSDWSTAPVEESDTVAVETRTLYRYKG